MTLDFHNGVFINRADSVTVLAGDSDFSFSLILESCFRFLQWSDTTGGIDWRCWSTTSLAASRSQPIGSRWLGE